MDTGVPDVDAAEGAQHRPAASPAQGRGVRGRPVGRVEEVGGAVGQQDPGRGQVAGRVAGEEVAEVDHAAEGAVRRQDVGRVQVAVEPDRRARPFGCGGGVLPDRADGLRVGDQPAFGGRGEPVGELFGGVGQRAPAVPARGRPVGGGAVEGGQEVGQGDGRLRGTGGGGAVGGLARYPGGDDPGPRKPCGRLAEALRDGDRQGKVRGEGGQPGVFLAQQLVRGPGGPGQPDGEVVAEPPHLVVPATCAEFHRPVRQVGVLLAQQVPDQVLGDLRLGGRHGTPR
ncbi:hypothetical protein ASD26_16030 [Streptomyces sp. Root1319]|nr:hypothetical protein ASD26_16030 [Streptomyces sp. Root1319]